MEVNLKIRFYKVVFTFIIALYHLLNAYGRNTSWYIAVEFFFYVSGYLIANSYENHLKGTEKRRMDALAYTIKRWMTFFPFTFASFVIAFVIKGIYNKYTLFEYAKCFLSHLPELMLIHACGLGHGSDYYMNSVTWYISVLLLLGYVIWYLLDHKKDAFIKFISPILVVLIYSYLYRTYGYLGEHYETIGFLFNSALLRGFAGLSVGVIAFYLKKRIKVNASKWFGYLPDVCFLSVIVLAAFCNATPWDFLFAFLLAVGVFFSFYNGNQCIAVKLYDNKAVKYLSGISLSIYLNHKIFRSIWKYLFPTESMIMYVAYLLFIIIFSTMIKIVVTHITNKLRTHYKK